MTKPYEPRIRDVPGYETHAMRDIIIYDDVEAELYDKDLLIGPADCLSGILPSRRSS